MAIATSEFVFEWVYGRRNMRSFFAKTLNNAHPGLSFGGMALSRTMQGACMRVERRIETSVDSED